YIDVDIAGASPKFAKQQGVLPRMRTMQLHWRRVMLDLGELSRRFSSYFEPEAVRATDWMDSQTVDSRLIETA
ncbi:hypothetical protein ACFFQG_31590, partial [Shinella granuli]